MSLETLVREAVADATRAIDRERRHEHASARVHAIAELAADIALARCPRLEGRVSREQLIEWAMAEGD